MKKNLREVMISLTLSIAVLSALVAGATTTAEVEASTVPAITFDNNTVAKSLTDWGTH